MTFEALILAFHISVSSLFVFFKLSAILFEKESPNVVGIGVAERGGLGLLENGDTDLELTPNGISIGLGAVRFNNNPVAAILQQKVNVLH
ncbi:uncharacterized protein HKW66_Vig0059370 [Vigna angularis]|uniref:Uncharacterized protein n=1 Tax=Phaseolus angularis TaxID=3914 RepID=A0A8T0L1U6_PHAAN|nr:uncharacterized protein HKW66_Vig0059370 [Vigna angularis]